MRKYLRETILAFGAFALALGTASSQPSPTPVASTHRPMLGAQVLVVPGNPGRFQVLIAFPQEMPRAALEERFRRVEAALGAKCGARQLDTRRGISTLAFATAAPLVDAGAGTLRLDPFVRSLSDRGDLQVTFAVPEWFTYRRTGPSADKSMEIVVSEEKGQVNIAVNKRRNGETRIGVAASSGRGGTLSGRKLWGGILLLLVAIGTGLGVHRFARRAMAR